MCSKRRAVKLKRGGVGTWAMIGPEIGFKSQVLVESRLGLKFKPNFVINSWERIYNIKVAVSVIDSH